MVATLAVPASRGRAGGLRAGGGSVAAEARRGPPLRHAAVSVPHLPRALRQRSLQHTGTIFYCAEYSAPSIGVI